VCVTQILALISYIIFMCTGTPLPEGLKKNRPDLNSALLEQFVSLIPGTMFEKSLSTQLRSEIELSGSPRKENYTQNMVHFHFVS
jgi:hypothetical protein